MASRALRCRWRNCPTPGPFSDDKTLFEHLNDTHNGRPGRHPDFVCRWEGCKTLLRPSSISSRSHRARHIIVHTGYQPFVCERDGCGATFRRKEQYRNHIEAHSRDEASDDEAPAQPVRCKTCQKTFSRGSAMKTHMGFAHRSGDGRNSGQDGGKDCDISRSAFCMEVEGWSDDEAVVSAGANVSAGAAAAGYGAAPGEERPHDRDTWAKLQAAEERIRELEARQAKLQAILRGGK